MYGTQERPKHGANLLLPSCAWQQQKINERKKDQIHHNNQELLSAGRCKGSVSSRAWKKHWSRMSSLGVDHFLLHVKAFISRADNNWLAKCDAPSKSGLQSNAFHAKLHLGLQRGEKSQPWLGEATLFSRQITPSPFLNQMLPKWECWYRLVCPNPAVWQLSGKS